MQIFNFGSINIDHIYRVPHLVKPGETLSSTGYQQVLGGKGANQSIAMARTGLAVTHIGRYHPSDQALLTPLLTLLSDASLLQASNQQASGHAMIQVDDHGENNILLHAGSNHSFQPEEVAALLAHADSGDWLLLQNECSCTAEMIQAAVNKGMRVAFNPAPMTAAVQDYPLDKLRLLFVNQVEAAQLLSTTQENTVNTQWLAEQFQRSLPETEVVITLGASGACWCYQGQTIHMPAPRVNAVDTTGAGDTFIGYYLHGVITGLTTTQALEQACAAGALCVQHPGASVSIPTLRAVRQLLESTDHAA